ncbi:hypothetical protein ATO67_05115 [Agrobacterium bohemicum]|uniref:Uncharacterized protein n=1 Tax=Agrobacterium bohemicum TaxID=2052828 RepID=A0A135P3M3_9HYPH|nr:hypothetical protein ATO67_05115 [Agrobacterium bohemicum]
MTWGARKRTYSRFLGESSGWVARGGVQMSSQMNGCHVPGQTGAIQNPAYRPTGKFLFITGSYVAHRHGARKYLLFLMK